jgi:hypothetical protein
MRFAALHQPSMAPIYFIPDLFYCSPGLYRTGRAAVRERALPVPRSACPAPRPPRAGAAATGAAACPGARAPPVPASMPGHATVRSLAVR